MKREASGEKRKIQTRFGGSRGLEGSGSGFSVSTRYTSLTCFVIIPTS